MSTPFPYAARARDVEEAHRAVSASFLRVRKRSDLKDPATAKWLASLDQFNAALAVAYPKTFWSDLEGLRSGDTRHIDMAIEFLEADPVFFRSGYTKAEVLRAIKRLPLTPKQKVRLRRIVLHRIPSRGGREFRQYCHLARRIDGAGFRESVAQFLASKDAAVARRAQWVLSAIEQNPRPKTLDVE
jgi:hypothetical protein